MSLSNLLPNPNPPPFLPPPREREKERERRKEGIRENKERTHIKYVIL